MTPYDAYVNTAKTGMTDREIEAEALTKAALLLKSCQQSWDAPDREQRLAEALEFNQKLWTIFQASLSQPDHPMAPALRQDIMRLGLFIDNRIFEVMAYPEAGKLTAIIQINQNLAAGLRTEVPAADNVRPSAYQMSEERQESIVWA